MRSDLHKTRIAGDYVFRYVLNSGEIKKGVHVMTPEVFKAPAGYFAVTVGPLEQK